MGWSSNRPTDYFAVGVQSAKGTEATTFRFPKHLTGSGFEVLPDVADEREGGGGQEVGLSYKKMIKADGNLSANLRGVSPLYAIIDAALGQTATTLAPASNAVANDFTDIPSGAEKFRMVPAPTLPYITVEQRYSDQVERVSDAKANQLTIDGGAGLPLKIAAALSGAGTVYQRDIASALTTAYDTTDPIYFARGSYVITGLTASGAKLTKFKTTISRHLDEGVQTTDLYRDDLIELVADYNFDCTLKYEDRLLYQGVQYAGGSTVPIPLASLNVSLYSNNGLAQGATAYRAIKVNHNNLLAKSAKVNKLEPDGKTVYIDLACTSIKPPGATDTLVIDLIAPSAVYANFP